MPKQAERTELNNLLEKEPVRFTKKQRDFFNFISLGYPPSQAAKKAGYSPKSYRSSAMQNTQNYTYAFRQAFSILGLGLPEISEKMKEGCEATRTISASVIVKSDDPTVRDQKANGLTVDFIDVPDFLTRHKYLDSTVKLQGLYAPDKHELSGEGGGPIPISGKVLYVSNILHNGKPTAPTAKTKEEKKCLPQSKKKKK